MILSRAMSYYNFQIFIVKRLFKTIFTICAVRFNIFLVNSWNTFTSTTLKKYRYTLWNFFLKTQLLHGYMFRIRLCSKKGFYIGTIHLES